MTGDEPERLGERRGHLQTPGPVEGFCETTVTIASGLVERRGQGKDFKGTVRSERILFNGLHIYGQTRVGDKSRCTP